MMESIEPLCTLGGRPSCTHRVVEYRLVEELEF
jgi:hypothetical protein